MYLSLDITISNSLSSSPLVVSVKSKTEKLLKTGGEKTGFCSLVVMKIRIPVGLLWSSVPKT